MPGNDQTNPLEGIAKVMAFQRAMDARRRALPAEWYEPHSVVARNPFDPDLAGYGRKGKASGQLQFHQAPHIMRIMAPGNGWGGSTAMGCEIDAWMRHTNRWQVTPSGPITAIWVAPTLDQFDQLYKDVLFPRCWGTTAVLVPHGPTGRGSPQFRWPDGGTLVVVTHRTSWMDIQGINPHIVAFDEVPPKDMWDEFVHRRRGDRKTRFICKATQAEGYTWMARDIYEPWLEHHRAAGMDEEAAMIAQTHEDMWVWPRGGIHDNPANSDDDCRFYERRKSSSKKKRKVRLFGGFESFVGDCIFDEEALDRMRARAAELEIATPARTGSLFVTRYDPDKDPSRAAKQRLPVFSPEVSP